MQNLRGLIFAATALFAAYFPIALWLDRNHIDDRPDGRFVIHLYRPFEPTGGNAFLASHLLISDAKLLAELGNDPSVEGDTHSPIMIYEDRLKIGPAHSTFADVSRGYGRFNNFRGGLVFSASDNSNPNTNGRRYWAVVPRSANDKQ